MATIGAVQLVMRFLSQTAFQVDKVQPIPSAMLRKIGKSLLDRTITGVSYILNSKQYFFISFDEDFGGQAVVQKTYWGEETDSIYNMVKGNAMTGKTYPGSTGFYIYSQQLGYLLVEKQILEGESASQCRENVFYNHDYLYSSIVAYDNRKV